MGDTGAQPHLVGGQVAEFLAWAELIQRSGGMLHVFLPLWDRGIDALLHRRTDGAYLPVQVKSRSTLHEGFAHYIVPAHSLADDRALLLFVQVDGDHFGPRVAVIEEGKFKVMVPLTKDSNDLPIHQTAIHFETSGGSEWAPYIVELEELPSALGLPATMALSQEPPPATWVHPDRSLGNLGEAEAVRQLAAESSLSIFRPFPDLETAEVVVRHETSFRTLGIQVKTVSIENQGAEAAVNIQAASFETAPSTWVLALAWLRDLHCFHDQCLLIPTTEVAVIASLRADHLTFAWTPGGSQARSRLAHYRRERGCLGFEVAALLS